MVGGRCRGPIRTQKSESLGKPALTSCVRLRAGLKALDLTHEPVVTGHRNGCSKRNLTSIHPATSFVIRQSEAKLP